MVQVRIDMAIQWSDMPGPKPRAEFIERAAPAITQDEIEVAQPRFTDIGHAFAGLEPGKRYRRIKIVEHPQRTALFKHDVGRSKTVGAIGSDDRNVRVGQVGGGSSARALPIVIQLQPAARNFVQVPHVRVVRNVTLVEHDMVSALDQGLAEPTPKRGVSITP